MEIARNYSQRSHPLSRMLTGSMCTLYSANATQYAFSGNRNYGFKKKADGRGKESERHLRLDIKKN